MNATHQLVVMCARAMQQPMQQLARAFGDTKGQNVEFRFGTVGALKQRLAAGETADLIIASLALITELEKTGAIMAGTRTVLGHASIGIAGRAGAPAPDVSTAKSFTHALLSARAIAVTDAAAGGSAGVYLPSLFERLGITAAIEPKLRRQRGGDEVAACVARGEAEIGMTMTSEILAVPGAVVIGPLPPGLGHDIAYAAGVSARSTAATAARSLLDFVKRPETRAVWQAAGFAVP